MRLRRRTKASEAVEAIFVFLMGTINFSLGKLSSIYLIQWTYMYLKAL